MNRVDLNLMKFELEENKVVFYFDEVRRTNSRIEFQNMKVVV